MRSLLRLIVNYYLISWKLAIFAIMKDYKSNIIQISENGNGNFSCDVPITKGQWLELLYQTNIIEPAWIRVLLSFYFMPGHKASCAQCAEKYGYHMNVYNVGIKSVGRAVVKTFGNFSVVDEAGKEHFWPVAIGVGKEIKVNGVTQFEWQLRRELVEAIKEYLINVSIDSYIADIDKHWKEEMYKWQAVMWFQQHWHLEETNLASMIELATGKTGNLLASMNSFPRGMMIEFAKVAPHEVREMFVGLYDESQPLGKRVPAFITKAEELRTKYNPGNWNSHYQTTNAISVYLWLRYPDKYYIYKYTEYKAVAEKLGLDFSFKKNGNVSELIKGFKMYDMLNSHLCKNSRIKELISTRTEHENKLYRDPQLRTATIDFGFYISRWFDSIEKELYSKNTITMSPFISQASAILKSKKNIILQGAPGTGKTYNTAALALAIIDGTVPENHRDVMERYEHLRAERRIGFTTFHQSMDYEDFIEGIKPVHDNGLVRYEVEDGIFKRMCEAAKVASEVAASGSDDLMEGMNENPTIWKVSLEGTGDNPTRRDCMKNGHIRIGWHEYGDIDFTEDNPKVTEGKSILRAFQNDIKIGDIIVSCWSANETDAIGIVTGDYEYREEGGKLPRYRDVRWIVKDIRHNIRDINNGKRMTLGTVYRLSISLRDILDVIETYVTPKKSVVEISEKPFVLVIDEINRGNVSKIFGELLTLIEKDKRLGDYHPVTLSLPYSKQAYFGVPQNLYIIGTMNTTDRSTGTIDYAIRRRFAFITVPAERDVIDNEMGKLLFDNVKSFIERFKYADMDLEDLMVGHSYFMSDTSEELLMKVRYEIIPLIKEYIKDGILSVRSDEAKLYFNAWQKLETVNDNHTGTSED